MPISKEKWKQYPADWPAISAAAKERAGWKCEACGLTAGEWGYRTATKEWVSVDRAKLEAEGKRPPFWLALAPGKLVKVVDVKLTTAHRDHTPANCDPANLVCWCDYHHLTHDGARANRLRKAEAQQRRSAVRATLAVGDLFDDPPKRTKQPRRRRPIAVGGAGRTKAKAAPREPVAPQAPI